MGILKNARWEKFTQDWIKTGNKTEAYRRNYKVSRMKEETINNKAYQLSNKDDIKARYEELLGRAAEKSTITAQMVIDELAKIAFSDVTNFVEIKKGNLIQSVELKNTKELTDDQKKIIASIKQGANGIELKLYDKLSALEKLGRYFKLFTDKVEHSGKIDSNVNYNEMSLEQMVQEARDKGMSEEEIQKLIKA